MSEDTQTGLVVQCEVPGNRVIITRENTDTVPIPFVVTRRTPPGRPTPARIEALIVPLENSNLPPARWEGWLSLDREREQMFDDDGSRSYNVLVELPENAPLGEYRFVLRVLGVGDPDEQFAESDEVVIEVKGREPNVLVFTGIALALLLLIAGAAVGVTLYLMNRATLSVDLQLPESVVAGQVAPYSLSVTNKRAMTLSHVSLIYTPPEGVLDATARVEGSSSRRCHKLETTIECDLGALAGQQGALVHLSVIPGPGAQVLTHTNVMTLTYLDPKLKTRPVEPPQDLPTSEVEAGTSAILAIAPPVGRAVVNEEMTVELVAWAPPPPPTDTLAAGEGVTATAVLTDAGSGAASDEGAPNAFLIYELPKGWRYAQDPPAENCSYLDYFTLQCPLGSLDAERPDRVSLGLVPTQVTPEDVSHNAYLVDERGQRLGEASVVVPAAETDLYFDGQESYAELGRQGTPETLTVEMWVHPYSIDDGQAFFGMHDQEGQNQLLIGYYEDGLHVNLRGTRTTITGTQRTTRHHLAVVINPIGGNNSEISVLIDGRLQRKPDVVNQVLDKNVKTLNWVLGQDWDPGREGPVKSDFFTGRMANVRVWNEARTPGEILDTMHRTLCAAEIRDLRTLVGDWPLVPDPNSQATALVERVSTIRGGASQDGERVGARWWTAPPNFGLTLRFDGVRDVAPVPDLVLPTNAAAVSRDKPYAVSLSAWVHVDAIPTDGQWIVGHVGSKPEVADAAIKQALNERLQAEERLLIGTGKFLLELPAGDPIGDVVSMTNLALGSLLQAEKALVEARTQPGVAQEAISATVASYVDAQVVAQKALSDIKPVLQRDLEEGSAVLDSQSYIVQLGETLQAIADRYRMNALALLDANKLERANQVFPGQTLIFPAEELDAYRAYQGRVDDLLSALAARERANARLRGLGAPDYVVYALLSELMTGVDSPALLEQPLPEARWGALIVDSHGYPAVVARQSARGAWVELPDRKPIPVDRWVHLTGIITYHVDGPPSLALFKDGLDVRNVTLPATDRVGLPVDACSPGVYVGGLCPEARGFYEGLLDDIRIWERALDADELARWKTRPGEFHDEVAYWPLDDGPGRQVVAGACTIDQSCNVRVNTPGTADGANDRYHLPVRGPGWVEADPADLYLLDGDVAQ